MLGDVDGHTAVVLQRAGSRARASRSYTQNAGYLVIGKKLLEAQRRARGCRPRQELHVDGGIRSAEEAPIIDRRVVVGQIEVVHPAAVAALADAGGKPEAQQLR